MSESPGNGQPQSGSGPPPRSSSPPPRSSSQSGRGSDPVADMQRWLVKAGARSMATQVAGQVRNTLGAQRRQAGDVWDVATNELPASEPPECQWCPVCQAARRARESGPGIGARLADASGTLAAVMQDAFSAFEQVMKAQDQNHDH